MVVLTILCSLIFAERETLRDSILGNTRHWNRFLIRFTVPIIIGLITWSWLLGLLAFSTFYLIFDPLLNKRRNKKFFATHKGTIKQVISGEKSFYDVIDGRIAFTIEVLLFIILLYINLKTK